MRMKFTVLRSTLIALLLLSVAYGQDDLQAKLRNELLNTHQTLRKFPTENHLRYNAVGNLLTKSPSGAWTSFGQMVVEELELKPEKLEIRGHRTVLVFDADKQQMEPKEWPGQRVTIEIATAGNTSLEPLKAVLQKVFITSREEILTSLPDYWKPYFISEQGGTNGCGKESDALDVQDATSTPRNPRQGGKVTEGENTRHAYPLPTLASKSAGAKGSLQLKAVIATNGKVKDICILKPLGAGLDDSSVAAVRLWEYTPYKLNGKPVEIKTTINFSFR